MNEKNFSEYLTEIPSIKKKHCGQIKTLKDVEKENLQLNEDLRGLNAMLSELIGKRGLKNMLEQQKEGKETFKERPVSRQVKVLKGEISNGEKMILMLEKEKKKVDKMLEKVASPVIFSEMMKKIQSKKKRMKELKAENFELTMENKKVEKQLEKGGLGQQGMFKKLLIQYNNMKGKNQQMEAEIQRLMEVKEELCGKKDGLKEKREEVEREMKENGLEGWDRKVQKKYEEVKKLLEKEQHRKKVALKGFTVKEENLKKRSKD